ncbi:MAG: hypothetical protein ACTSYA_02365 [Candidatus Kariarchaeaceae archaeon]
MKTREFCPPKCDWLNKYLDEDCPPKCWHLNDEAIRAFDATVFGNLETIIGKNGNERYLLSGGSVHKSQVKKR